MGLPAGYTATGIADGETVIISNIDRLKSIGGGVDTRQVAPIVAGLDAEFALIAVSDAFIIAMGYVAMSIAPRLLTGAEVAMTMLLQVLLAPLLVFICLGEAPSRWTLSGGSLLLVVLLAHEAVGLFRCEAGGAGGRDREQLEAVVTPPDDRGSVNQACNQATTAIDHQSGSRSRAQ